MSVRFGFFDYFLYAFQSNQYIWALAGIAMLVSAVFSIMLHEIAHGWVAWKNGDPTAKYRGRLTLNPVKHFDLFGFLCFFFIGFGWAKPVPVNDSNFRSYRKGLFWVAIAGVLTNLILAFISYPLMQLSINWYNSTGNDFAFFIAYLFQGMWQINLLFIVFNLLPIYPLDGFRVLEAVMKRGRKFKNIMYEYGQWILIAVLVLIYFMSYPPVNFSVFNFLSDLLGYPIARFWGLFF